MTGTHWHVATGFAGYGPEGDDCPYGDDMRSLADVVRAELATVAEHAHQLADGLAEMGDYESAWKTYVHARDVLEPLAANLSNEREQAPVYRDNPQGWVDTIARIVSESFPVDTDPSGNSRLYVWEVNNSECEHDDE